MKFLTLLISSLLFSCSVTSKGTNGKDGENGKDRTKTIGIKL